MPATPKKKPSQHQRELAKARAARRSPKNFYLVAYNAASALGWAYVLYRLVAHLLTGTGDGGIKAAVGLETAGEKLLGRARTGYSDFGDVVKLVQTAALLEAVHSGLGLVRSGILTTAAQIASRILVVWYICPFYPQVAASPIYISMVFAWSFTEVVRYLHYVASLVNVKVPVLEWLRYSTFYLMYPLGAGSECYLIFRSAAYAQQHFGILGYVGTLATAAFWPPALFVMMSHMHKQRNRHLVNPGKKISSATKAKIEAAQGSASAPETPSRITRSRSKANLS
ncbi:tyrosine phosphatase-like protein [Leucosporidium creatinivorum]|uniref:Very-long-chain (3R)-3-hydroxyacyl-CoA dehydratase n=1 Tax=Leucosporidium creatinivorum TaxID=106004 RepID=A0A1Y2D515_9BASI|nr:tyrosine phosphatase-like protein [Leucosporidium creatinivorum]